MNHEQYKINLLKDLSIYYNQHSGRGKIFKQIKLLQMHTGASIEGSNLELVNQGDGR